MASCSTFTGSDSTSSTATGGDAAAATDDAESPGTHTDGAAGGEPDAGGADGSMVPPQGSACAPAASGGTVLFCDDFDHGTQSTYTNTGNCGPNANGGQHVSSPNALELQSSSSCYVQFNGATSAAVWTVSFDVYLSATVAPNDIEFANLKWGTNQVPLRFAAGGLVLPGANPIKLVDGWNNIRLAYYGSNALTVTVASTQTQLSVAAGGGALALQLGTLNPTVATQIWFDDVRATSP